jgi:serine/threonine protein kinase
MSQFQKLDSGGQGQIYAVNSDTVYKSIKFSDHYKEISELCVLSSLPHPNIVKIKRYELTRNDCKIYMERLHSNIYDYSKKCTFEKRLEMFPQIFWTMVRVARFFQVNGIINCDIKSENVMISKDGKTVKVIDFGHLICDENYPIIGTRSYQPPELWLEDKYNYKSMVWSIGISAL